MIFAQVLVVADIYVKRRFIDPCFMYNNVIFFYPMRNYLVYLCIFSQLVLSFTMQELTNFRVQNGLGTYILSTSWGIMTDIAALKKRIGGLVLLSVY